MKLESVRYKNAVALFLLSWSKGSHIFPCMLTHSNEHEIAEFRVLIHALPTKNMSKNPQLLSIRCSTSEGIKTRNMAMYQQH